MSTSKLCRQHPHQKVVGVCALCLKERLLALMIEDEDYLQINARDSSAYSSTSVEASQMAQDSPFHNRACHYVSSSHHPSFNIFTDNCKASISTPSPASRRHGMEYDRDDVRHVASLYLQRHHSLSSSPLQKQSLKFPSPLLTSQYKGQARSVEIERASIDRDAHAGMKKPVNGVCTRIAASSTPRKKKGSLWSLLQRRGRNESKIRNEKRLNSKIKEELHRRSLHDDFPCKTPTLAQSQFSGEQYKLPYGRHSGKGAHDILSGKGNAYSSLLSSPKSFQSRLAAGATASSCLLSPASSRQCTPLSPLHNTDGEKANRSFMGHANRELFSEDGLYSYDDDDVKSIKYYCNNDHMHHGSKFWISSLFPRKEECASSRVSISSSTGITSSHDYATHLPSRRESVSASPKSTTPRRKSVSFLDDHVAAARTQKTSNKIAPNASQSKLQSLVMDISRNGVLDDHESLSALRDMCRRPSNAGVVKADRPDLYVNANGDASRDASLLSLVNESDQQLMKSPRLRIANLLPKKSSNLGMDCTRDTRVSPSPISLTEISKQSQHVYSERYGGDEANHVVGLHRPAYSYRGRRSSTGVLDPDYEDPNMGVRNITSSHKDIVHVVRSSPASSPLKLQRRASVLKDTHDAELTEDGDVIRAKYLEMYKEKEEESAGRKPAKSSWGTLAWSKTLSPMLGLRGKLKKKKKAIESCSSLHGQINRRNFDNAIMRAASNHEEHLQYNNVINANDGVSAVSVSGLHQYCGTNYALNGQESDCQSLPSSRLGREIIAARNSERINKALSTNHEQLQLSPEAVFTPEHRRPPQQYSFLSKDYSAFSYYFSPARSSSCSNVSNGSSNISISSLQSNNSNTSNNMPNSIGSQNSLSMKMKKVVMGMQGERRRASVISDGTAITDHQSHMHHAGHHRLHHHHHQQQPSLMISISDCDDDAAFLSSSPPRHSVDGASWTSYPSLFKQRLLPSYNAGR